jgi:hypothetical protein
MSKTIQHIIDFIRDFNINNYPNITEFKYEININEYNTIGNNYINILENKFNNNIIYKNETEKKIIINYNQITFNICFNNIDIIIII